MAKLIHFSHSFSQTDITAHNNRQNHHDTTTEHTHTHTNTHKITKQIQERKKLRNRMTTQRRTPSVERRPAASSVTARRRRLQRHVGSEPLPLTALADIRLSAEAGSHTTLSLTDRLRDKTALVFSVLFLYYSLLQSPSLILHNSGDDWIREIVF